MKRIIQLILQVLAGFAIAAVLLAILLPWLIRGGYLETGTPAGLWIIGIVSLLCVALVVFWPWKSRQE
ncbi:MAG: hypothetical protein ACRD1Q_08040 [Vicinamibacterales bacterium]